MYIISAKCKKCPERNCVESCPVDCIYEYKGSEALVPSNQLYIHSEDCINCGACESVCAQQAIFEDSAVPAELAAAIAWNESVSQHPDQFAVASGPSI